MNPSGVVTLLTDFGLADGYVAAMKGVILGRAPAARLVDISHAIDRHDIAGGAYVLASVIDYFPAGTVHLAVVDPGVGSSREAVALRTDRAWYVGPDNGLLWRAAGHVLEQVTIKTVGDLPGFSSTPSATFHGRDLFAPAAAHLATGGALADLGPRCHELQPLELPATRTTAEGVSGQVIHIDSFGNAITNIDHKLLPPGLEGVIVNAGGTEIAETARCYADVAPGTRCALIGSDGTLEVAVAEGSAANDLQLIRGSVVECRIQTKGSGHRDHR